MKLLLREYLASLKERKELDAILPDLLSELGYTVLSRPGIGTVQHGVDIAAVGAPEGEQKMYLFTLKKGDLTRQDWDGNSQALRSSLNEIQDSYIPNCIPPEHKALKVVICICMGGEVKEPVRPLLKGYTDQHTADKLAFEEWNGDKLAGLLLTGVLREELLPKPLRSSFQKAVALLDEPDIAYRHFANLLRGLRAEANASPQAKVRVARQICLCLWILYVWGRDVGNVEAPYRASELALLTVWDLIKPEIGQGRAQGEAVASALVQLINLHAAIGTDFVATKIAPHVNTRHALSIAVDSRSAADVNLKLFDILGRVALMGLWAVWSRNRASNEEDAAKSDALAKAYFDQAMALIETNPALALPAVDHQATDIALVLLLWILCDGQRTGVASWLTQMTARLCFTIRSRTRYPITSNEYRDLVDHPRARTDEYFKSHTTASTLIPLIAAWLTAMEETEAASALADVVEKKLEHCTLQAWLLDAGSDEHLYLNTEAHGCALPDLAISDGADLLDVITQACREKSEFAAVSANATGNWPIVLIACRHWRLPIPPDFWIGLLRSDGDDARMDGGDD
jgi:hypothetical protein